MADLLLDEHLAGEGVPFRYWRDLGRVATKFGPTGSGALEDGGGEALDGSQGRPSSFLGLGRSGPSAVATQWPLGETAAA